MFSGNLTIPKLTACTAATSLSWFCYIPLWVAPQEATIPRVFINVSRPPRVEPYACPCCRYLTLEQRGYFEICPVCFWEDDGQDDHDADESRGGPNRGLSLTEARQNFATYGASDRRSLPHVRAPHPHEHPSA
jgi:hypothetical protein